MPTQAKSRVSPVDAALQRLLDLGARSPVPDRMAREMLAIIDELRRAEEPEVVQSFIMTLLEPLDAGVIDAEEQVSYVDQDQPAALAQAQATLAAIIACRDAARAALLP
jgi:hypothetical protein